MIGILKTHWVLGGAERYLSDLSSVLSDAGFPVVLASLDGQPRQAVREGLLDRSQAREFESWSLDRRAIERRSRELDVFINAVPTLAVRPAAKTNWLVVFSPGGGSPAHVTEAARWRAGMAVRRVLDVASVLGVHPDRRNRFAFHPYRAPKYAVARYERVLAISDFVRAGIADYWRRPSDVVYPCVELPERPSTLPRQKVILAIGRFLPSGNQKNHGSLIEAFRVLHARASGWRLVLMGGFEGSALEQSYLAALERLADGLPVQLLPNVDDERMRTLLAEASYLWHAAGLGSPADDYLNVEQFGIAVAEAAAHGVIPLVVAAGGVREIVPDGGYTWQDPAELAELTLQIDRTPGLWDSMSVAAQMSARRFTRERFREGVIALLEPATGRDWRTCRTSTG